MDAPLYLRIRFAEVAPELAHESKEYDGWLSSSWIQEEFIHLDMLPIKLNMERRYSFRFVEITVLDTSPKWKAVFSYPQITIESLVYPEMLSPVNLEDDMLNRIRQVSIKTLADCMSDVFEDGPKRDRRLWLGDLRLQALSNYATFKNEDLVLRCLYLFAAMPDENGRISANLFTRPKEIADDTFLFDYSLFFICSLYDYMQEFKRQEVLIDLYPAAEKQMEIAIHYVKDNGKIELEENYPVFVDWSNDFEKDGCAQTIMIYTLKQFIHLGKGMNKDMSRYEAVLKAMIEYTKEYMFNEKEELFMSGTGEMNIATQTWIVLAGIFEKEQNAKIMCRTVEKLFPIKNIATPYMCSSSLYNSKIKQIIFPVLSGF